MRREKRPGYRMFCNRGALFKMNYVRFAGTANVRCLFTNGLFLPRPARQDGLE